MRRVAEYIKYLKSSIYTHRVVYSYIIIHVIFDMCLMEQRHKCHHVADTGAI